MERWTSQRNKNLWKQNKAKQKLTKVLLGCLKSEIERSKETKYIKIGQKQSKEKNHVGESTESQEKIIKGLISVHKRPSRRGKGSEQQQQKI